MNCEYCETNTDAQLHTIGSVQKPSSAWLCPKCCLLNLYKFEVDAVWQEMGTYHILAKDLDDAAERVADLPLPDGSYVDDSHEIDGIRQIGKMEPQSAYASPLTTVKEENTVREAKGDVDNIAMRFNSEGTRTGRWPTDKPNLANVPKADPKDLEIVWEPESHWSEHPNWAVEDWKYEIADDNTRQGYHEWVRSKIEEMKEESNVSNV